MQTGHRIEDVGKEEEPINFDLDEVNNHKMLNYNENLRGVLKVETVAPAPNLGDKDTSGDLLRLKKK